MAHPSVQRLSSFFSRRPRGTRRKHRDASRQEPSAASPERDDPAGRAAPAAPPVASERSDSAPIRTACDPRDIYLA